ncbi:MAG TPA: alpha/beta fold hydrolase [Steroidobacteraceae bacterium]|jgi:pimeloyl-ACP methyl ester carboxylesterase
MEKWVRSGPRYFRLRARKHQLVLVATAALALAARIATAASVEGVAAPAPGPGGIAFSPCTLTHPTQLLSVEAECGRLAVPENPDAPAGRRIELFVARVPAVNLRKRPDPLFVLAGGPGQAATDFYTEAAAPLARIHRDRDIVLVDQRGTGRSNGLFCNMDDDSLWNSSDSSLVAEARRCLDSLSRHADVAYYTTSLAVQDLDRVRAALGYRTIDLYGESYGTRVALHYLRRFPQRVRAAILDGVVPPQTAVGASLAVDAQAALDAIFTRCTRDPQCQAAFGDSGSDYRALRAGLERKPVPVSISDPTTGKPVSFDFAPLHLAAVLRLASYTSEQAALLPFSLHEATRGDFGPLASQFLLVDRTYGNALAYGMHNSVVCTEDVPFYGEANVDRARLARTYLGSSQIDALERVCALWPRGPIDPDFHAPLDSSVPVMLLSGADDPVTPPANAEEVARGLARHTIVELDGMGHGQLVAPCIDRLMAEFVEGGGAARLDISCARRARPFPFFTSFAGPPP